MSQENVELVRRAFDAYEREGLDGLMCYLDPQVEWITTDAFLEAATYRGHEGVRRYLGAVIDEFDELRNTPENSSTRANRSSSRRGQVAEES
jgi:ketosteroid isomerase-like protein